MMLSDRFFDIIQSGQDQVKKNCRIKRYPDGSCDITVAEYSVFREAGWEEQLQDQPEADPPAPGAGSIERAKRRARASISDLALCSVIKYFVTLTLDGNKINRYDPAEVTKHLNYWLDNQVRRQHLAYILVPELHKDGAIHFHGFFNGALPVEDSGTILPAGGGRPRKPRSPAQRAAWIEMGGKPVYNLPRWGWGFSTAVELTGDRRRAINYVCKYITKGDHKVGGRWYYSGGDLRRPEVYLCNVSFSDFSRVEGAEIFDVPGLGCKMLRLTVDGGLQDE